MNHAWAVLLRCLIETEDGKVKWCDRQYQKQQWGQEDVDETRVCRMEKVICYRKERWFCAVLREKDRLKGSYRLLLERWDWICDAAAFSKSLDKNGRLEIGLWSLRMAGSIITALFPLVIGCITVWYKLACQTVLHCISYRFLLSSNKAGFRRYDYSGLLRLLLVTLYDMIPIKS